jgi:hypothetical protein
MGFTGLFYTLDDVPQTKESPVSVDPTSGLDAVECALQGIESRFPDRVVTALI